MVFIFSFDLYRYIVLKQFNNFKNYRYDFFIFSIFRFSIMFPVVVPRCSAPLQYPGWMGRSPRASCWVEVLEPDLFITFSLFLQCFHAFLIVFIVFFIVFHDFLIVFIVFSCFFIIFLLFSLFFHGFSWFSHCFHCFLHSISSFSHCFHCFSIVFCDFLIVFIVFYIVFHHFLIAFSDCRAITIHLQEAV